MVWAPIDNAPAPQRSFEAVDGPATWATIDPPHTSDESTGLSSGDESPVKSPESPATHYSPSDSVDGAKNNAIFDPSRLPDDFLLQSSRNETPVTHYSPPHSMDGAKDNAIFDPPRLPDGFLLQNYRGESLVTHYSPPHAVHSTKKTAMDDPLQMLKRIISKLGAHSCEYETWADLGWFDLKGYALREDHVFVTVEEVDE